MQQSDMEAAQRINRYILQEFYFRGLGCRTEFLRSVLRTTKKSTKSSLHKYEHTYYHKTTDRTNVRTNQTNSGTSVCRMEYRMRIMQEMSLMEKLNILSDAAKYDVACTSSGE
mgnify:CR=1 FL=1